MSTKQSTSQQAIEQARKRGIVPGVTVACARISTDIEIVPDYHEWTFDNSIIAFHSKGGKAIILRRHNGDWAKVLPTEAVGLVGGDACQCEPAMRDAIIALAIEFGLCEGNKWVYLRSRKAKGVCVIEGKGLIHSCLCFDDLNCLTPEAFIAKMCITAAKPKPLTINDHEVKFEKGEIRVGCQTISNAVVRAVAEKLID